MKWFSKILALLGVGVVCTACYGMPHTDYRPYQYGSVKGRVTDENGTPINKIKVSSTSADYDGYTYTGTDGWYNIHYEVEYETAGILLEFDDIDGTDNGGEFASTSTVVPLAESTAPDVVMSLKN